MHDTQPLTAGSGRPVILLHGRGASAQDLLGFAQQHLPDAQYIALQADGREWYPRPFMRPREENEPALTAALEAIQRAIRSHDPSDVIILGFSQGACLAAEFAARTPQRYGGIIALSGGLIGSEVRAPNGSLDGTPVLMGCSENDPYIPLERVQSTAEAFENAGADVTVHTYPARSHTITEEEIALARKLIRS